MDINLKLALSDYFIDLKGYTEYDVRMFIANKLYEIGVIGTYQGSQIAGISQIDFALQMGKYGVCLLDISDEELNRQIEKV
jgi:hypothetical protein